MAQALFDEHPLEEYLRDAGESALSIPGSSSELWREIDPYFDFDDASDEALSDWCPQFLVELLEVFQSSISAHSPHSANPFVERFKYNVISSSLLAPSLPTPHPGRSPRTLSIPGKLHHSRTSSIDLELDSSPPPSPAIVSDASYGPLSCAIASLAVSFSLGFPSLSFLSFSATIFLLYRLFHTTETFKNDMTSSFNALDDLIASNEMWESVVQNAVSFLDKEERNHFQSSSNSSPHSPIRVALRSCLQQTHTQSDNIRHLFSALTSPPDLSQLSEMYAPPSPTMSSSVEASPRPYSYPSIRTHLTPSYPPTTPENKRATWNGSYPNLVHASSPTTAFIRRRERRDNHQLDLSDVFNPVTNSAPATPLVHTSHNPPIDISENSMSEGLPTGSSVSFSPLPSYFGAAALDLQRKRKSGGMEAFRELPASYFATDPQTPRSARNSIFAPTMSSTKFTNPQPMRHPLSYTALTCSLQGALAAKRYACSHLLALRFKEEEDEGYWEDVRSVMGLLTSSLADGYSRLAEALHEVEQQNLRDQNPTPSPDVSPARNSDNETAEQEMNNPRPRDYTKLSFAPMPNHVARFAAHVAVISSALDDARDDLEQCVDALKSDPQSSNLLGSSRRSRHSKVFSPALNGDAEVEEPRALQAYERLRRELGLALRECERGRSRLLELINLPVTTNDDEEEFDDLPSLGHDGSDDSDKPDPGSPFSDDDGQMAESASRTVVSTEPTETASLDDATSHLLMQASSMHLPTPGIEEVFEADTGARVIFSRDKSKLPREERIKLAKARRENGVELPVCFGAEGDSDLPKMGVEKWGPGGEVVQELMDVIWKVSERKRMMSDQPLATEAAPPSSLENS